MKKDAKCRFLFAALCIVLMLSLLPVYAGAAQPPSEAGSKVLSGGQRDFIWPVPGNYGLSSCFMDHRNHYALDISADRGTTVVASYDGTVIATYSGCKHNYGKTSSCCDSGFGNYVVMEHTYTLKGGRQITLYSRYSHLTAVSVRTGQTIKAGTKVGTVGSTGYSTGDHLDFQILYGGWTPFRNYSLDPYINELLELPEGLYCASTSTCCGVGPTACCCAKYVKYVKEYYPSCVHERFDASGKCLGCGFHFAWDATKDPGVMGHYTAATATASAATPYAAAQENPIRTIQAGASLQVIAVVTNGGGQQWYLLSDNDGGGYVPASALTLSSYLDSRFECTLSLPAQGQTLLQQSYSLSGEVRSLYPLRKVSGYIDGKYYGSWTSSGTSSSIRLDSTAINTKLYFAQLSPGMHTLKITATDSTGRGETTVLERSFSIAAPAQKSITITFDPGEGSCETPSAVLAAGSAPEALPDAQREGFHFTGWFAKEGNAVTSDTVIAQDITLYAGWEAVMLNVMLGDEPLQVQWGQTIPQFPQLQKEGHFLLGWFTAQQGGTLITPETAITEALTLYPQWQPCQYTVKLDTGDGSISEMTVTYGSCYGFLPTPSRSGYEFAGWLLDDQAVEETTAVLTPADHTLTASWQVLPTQTPTPDIQEPERDDFPYWSIPIGIVVLAAAVVIPLLKKQKPAAAPAEEASPDEQPEPVETN